MGAYAASDCKGTVKFLQWQELYERERPFWVLMDVPKDAVDQRTTNLVFEDVEQDFRDVRGREHQFSLDQHGFMYLRRQIDFEAFNNQEAVTSNYLPQLERLLQDHVDGVDKVFFFDWRLRNSTKTTSGTVIDLNDPTDWLRPSLHVHIDQTPAAVLNRILQQLPEEADALLAGRVRVINIWKPLKTFVEDWPIAVADGSKINPRDLIETDHVRRQYTGSNFNALSSPDFKWHYLHRQTPDEILLLKNFDSSDNVKAKYCPHVSFRHPGAPSSAPVRESIEVRALVFTSAV